MNRVDRPNTDYVSTRRVGDAAVTAINEGQVLWAPELNAPEDAWRAAMPEVDAEGRIPADHHAFHIRLRDASVLVDAGFDDPGSEWSRRWLADWPGSSRTPGLLAGLAAIGVAAEDVTHVIITHAHYDHVVGLTVERDGQQVPRFPGARVLLGRRDWEDHVENEDGEAEIRSRLRLIERGGLLDLVEGDREVVPGLWMLHAPGESPGHSIVHLQSGDAHFYALGDLFHHAREVEHSDWHVPWADPAAMSASRERFMREAAETEATVAFAHEPFPPWGRIMRTDRGYHWQRG